MRISGDSISNNILILNCTFRDNGGRAINSQGAQHHITIRHSRIFNNKGNYAGGILVNSLDINGMRTNPHHWIIENNWIHDIGDAASTGPAIAMHQGCYIMTVRNNVIFRTKSGGILFYGYGGENDDESKSSVIESNFISGSTEAIGGYGDVVVRNNIVVDSKWAFFSGSYQGTPPTRLRICNNTFYSVGTIGVGVTDWDSARVCVFANNALITDSIVYDSPVVPGIFFGNIIAPPSGMVNSVPDLRDPENGDYYPSVGSALVGAAVLQSAVPDDFNGTLRDAAPDVGAYEFTGPLNPGWKTSDGFKER